MKTITHYRYLGRRVTVYGDGPGDCHALALDSGRGDKWLNEHCVRTAERVLASKRVRHVLASSVELRAWLRRGGGVHAVLGAPVDRALMALALAGRRMAQLVDVESVRIPVLGGGYAHGVRVTGRSWVVVVAWHRAPPGDESFPAPKRRRS